MNIDSWFALLFTGIAAGFDCYTRKIPNVLTLLTSMVAITYVVYQHLTQDALVAATICMLLLFFGRKLGEWGYNRAGFGMGDIKWMFPFGLFLGHNAYWALYLGIFLAAIYGLLSQIYASDKASIYLPFMPFLFFGIVLAHLFPLPQWFYLGT